MQLGWIKYVIAFILGGAIFTVVAPFLNTLIIFALIALIFLLIFVAFIPGGWLFGYFTVRSITSLLFLGRIGRTILLALLFSFISMLMGSRLAVPVSGLTFLFGGILGVSAVWSPPQRYTRPSSSLEPTKKRGEELMIELGRSGLLSVDGITRHEFESGVLVVGARARTVTRKIVSELAKLGCKIVIIGSKRLIPPNVSAEAYEVSAIDVSKDFEEYEDSADNMVYALALAHRLKNDDVSNLIPAARLVREGVLGGRVGRNEILQSIQVQDRRLAPLFASIASLVKSITPGGLHTSQILSSEAQVVCIEPIGSQRDKVFIISYLLQMLVDKGVVLIVEDPELIIKDINLLSYEAREPWEKLYLALEYSKQFGLILVSRDTPKTERVWNLCRTYILTELSELPFRLDERSRSLLPLIKNLKPMEAIISGEGDRKFRVEPIYPAKVKPKIVKPVAASKERGGVEARLEVEAGEEPSTPQPTMLEKAFGEKVLDAARILEQARSGLMKVSEGDRELLKRLEEKGYLTSFGGTYYTTATGEEALSEYQKAVKERGVLVRQAPTEEAGRAEEVVEAFKGAVQTVIDSEAESRMDEVLATYYMAESLFRQGKYGPCVMNCYEFMVNALKKFYNIEKGHLDDLVEILVQRGAETGLTINEAKDAKTLLIETSNALKEGRQVPLTSAQRMLRYARKVLDALQKTGGGGSEG